MPSLELLIIGQVQGVNFRATAKEKAEEVGVTGWVANNADGTVIVHAEGPDQPLQDFIDWCRVGPTSAHVVSVTSKEASPEQSSSFDIVY